MKRDTVDSLKAVFFDIDNTLIARDRSLGEILPRWLRKHVPELHYAQYESHVKLILEKDNSGYTDRYEFACWLQTLYQKHELNPDEILFELASLISVNIKPDPKLINFLFTLKTQLSIGLISNGSGKTQRAKLASAGLDEVFDADKIYIEGETGVAKPDRSMFMLPVLKFNFSPGEILFVGDHPVNDIMGASLAGMKTCWVNHGRELSDGMVIPDLMIDSIEDLLERFQCRV